MWTPPPPSLVFFLELADNNKIPTEKRKKEWEKGLCEKELISVVSIWLISDQLNLKMRSKEKLDSQVMPESLSPNGFVAVFC